MEKDFKYWFRWIAVLPGAMIASILSNFLLHGFLYFTFSILGVDIIPIKRRLIPFVIAITFILIAFKIAPEFKFRSSIVLAILIAHVLFSFISWFSVLSVKEQEQEGT